MTETASSKQIHLDDGKIRMLGIPGFGLIIPPTTGLMDGLDWESSFYWISYLYFILLSGLIWQGNRYLLFRTRQRFTWFDRPVEKLILLVLNNVFYTAPLTVAMICVWYSWRGIPKIDWDVVQVTALVNIICVLFVTHIYETVFMVKEHQNEQIRNAELLRAKAEADLMVLRNQVDPHFMFNSLNTLTFLILNDPPKALLFTENLAEVYRYILSQKDRSLVLLEDELDFTYRYADLLKLRFGESLCLEKSIDGTAARAFLIPPTSVFMAVENAVKHNEISGQNPLNISISLSMESLSIRNTVRKRGNLPVSAGIGLKNLDERFRLLTGKGIETKNEGADFRVSLPLIRVS